MSTCAVTSELVPTFPPTSVAYQVTTSGPVADRAPSNRESRQSHRSQDRIEEPHQTLETTLSMALEPSHRRRHRSGHSHGRHRRDRAFRRLYLDEDHRRRTSKVQTSSTATARRVVQAVGRDHRVPRSRSRRESSCPRVDIAGPPATPADLTWTRLASIPRTPFGRVRIIAITFRRARAGVATPSAPINEQLVVNGKARRATGQIIRFPTPSRKMTLEIDGGCSSDRSSCPSRSCTRRRRSRSGRCQYTSRPRTQPVRTSNVAEAADVKRVHRHVTVSVDQARRGTSTGWILAVRLRARRVE